MCKIKRLGIDIDGTVTCPTSLVPYLQKSFDENLKYEDITAYDLGAVLNKSDHEMYDWFMTHQEEIYTHSPIAEGALSVLTDWSQHYELYYISARYDYLDKITADWFDKHDVPFHHIELTGSHDKIAKARELKVDVFLEDKLDNAIEINEALNIPVILFDTPYNQSELPADVHRVYTWQEAQQIMQTL
ncbi:hypothetical protein ERX37_02075 [Macrococcus hajekii]|uniref:Nucleotidase n=1 Tax=Macrococcus hajekii TaxID=198482 RepID=A0A4R6BM56_9STAP|nr:hypothetical protein [Macrococcus hajekii]TDM02899.1 hypothetical protein ERX37_02075 [Macrococcus hajekii]GGB04748.1 putative nucleotidase YqfW [Macrococcus hajekii]